MYGSDGEGMIKSMKYRIMWKVWEYTFTERCKIRQTTVKLFEDLAEAARYCIENEYGGVEMLLIPKR